jgi:hypothetical protein
VIMIEGTDGEYYHQAGAILHQKKKTRVHKLHNAT